LTGEAKADLADDVAIAIEHALNGMIGTEIQVTANGSIEGIGMVVNLQGFAFCLPPYPAADPEPDPLPPSNAYGCVNAVLVAVDLLPDETGGEATILIDMRFSDLITERDRTLFCGEFGSGTVFGNGYILTNCTIHAGFAIVPENGCPRLYLDAVSIDPGPLNWAFTDLCLVSQQALLQFMLTLFDDVDDEYFTQVTELAFDVASQELCTTTAAPGWGESVLRLYLNQPNPFNPLTTIKYDVPVDGRVTLRVYDVRGALVRTLIDTDLPRGSHQATWDGRDASGRGMASGSYFARVEAGGRVETVRMSLVR
jgi:hypothetical protein